MRKWIILVLSIGAVVATYVVVRNNVRVDMPWNKPKFGTISRGDISVPITASGLIEPSARIEVKSKASGEVIEVRVREGDFVKKGDVLVLLRKIDEQRSVERETANVDRVTALVEQARISVKAAEQDIVSAEARLAQLVAEARILDFNVKKVERMLKEDQSNLQEQIEVSARFDMNAAQQKAAQAAVSNSRNSLETARENVKLQAATLASATKQLEDAQERLSETTIVSRHDAVVTDVFVKVGNLIQSGTSSLTGGTKVLDLADVSKKVVLARVDGAEYGRILAISPIQALPDMPGVREAAENDAENLTKRSGTVKLTIDAYRDESFEGVIERVEPQGKQNVGSAVIQFDVHVAVTDADAHKLPLGAQAQVEFTVDKAVGVLRVPTEAVRRFHEQSGIWIKVPPPAGSDAGHGKKFIPCRLGISDGEFTELLGGIGTDAQLKEGVEVYTKLPPKSKDDKDGEE